MGRGEKKVIINYTKEICSLAIKSTTTTCIYQVPTLDHRKYRV